ncbi:Gfo/Idh/MocA family protein [Paenibacillus glycinis]|uniref:Gfo/Idh/MocA family oxidoreductase n=1 Tax=Paenibacillus glycinis TaxID=2697035 RepID=A0ABW9XZP8_9BACL|nr:Gfo/Idh/MocA family oxidoreductase [Paenibacillus glycinis]NBD28209.1 Gfo/Idh/MocA family oxidoreductase [Paenibacillus glycinis]
MVKFKVVSVGCGIIANEWMKNVLSRTDMEIVALVDIRKDSADAMAERYGLTCPTFTDTATAISQTNADVVFDLTIPASHFSVCTTALKLGCSVFSEKPLAASMAEAHEMILQSERSGKSFSVMQNRRYDPNIRAYRNLVHSGTIGKPGYIGADFFIGAHFDGFRAVMDSPLVLDMAIHTFDQARFITDTDPVSVYCHEYNPPGSWYKGNASAICIFEMSDGSVFCYRGSWCAEGVPTSWEASWRVTGERGTAIWDGFTAPYAEIVAPREQKDKFIYEYSRVESDYTWEGNLGHAGCLDEMFAALKEGRPAETDCRDNIKSIEMVLGAVESARTGRKIYLKDFS